MTVPDPRDGRADSTGVGAPARTRVTVEVPPWVAALRDPGIRAVLVLFGLALAGFALLSLAWRGGARTPYVPLQMPWLISGGIAGLALIGAALAGWSIHLGRRSDAAHRLEVEDAVHDVATLCEEIRSGRRQLPRRSR